jgi:hypothetical protein
MHQRAEREIYIYTLRKGGGELDRATREHYVVDRGLREAKVEENPRERRGEGNGKNSRVGGR